MDVNLHVTQFNVLSSAFRLLFSADKLKLEL